MENLPCGGCRIVQELMTEIENLRKECRSKDEMIASLLEEKKKLVHRTGMNSANSSKPPSTDGFKRPVPQSNREKSGRKPGGQTGHKGSTITIPHEPDEVVEHLPQCCIGCANRGQCRKDGVFVCKESRYVVEAITLTKVVEHRSMSADCPHRKESVPRERPAGEFPENVTAHVQYGDSFKIIATLLNTMGSMSVSRISQLLRSMFGVTLSPGTIVSMTRKSSEKVAPALEEIKRRLIKALVAHSDETGTRIDGLIRWVHEVCTRYLTLMKICSKRGSEGIDEFGIVPLLKCKLVHDCWSAYFKYGNVVHALCNAHILRELKGIQQLEPDHTWPGRMIELLRQMKSAKEEAMETGAEELDPDVQAELLGTYDSILDLAETEHIPPPLPIEPKRGRKKLGKEGALINRMRMFKDGLLMFLTDFMVPFDNNQAERDFRNVKTKTKVAGSFRSQDGAQSYLDVMSFLITAGKNGVGMFQAMNFAFSDQSDIIFGPES